MSSELDAVTATANAAFRQAGDKVEHLLGQALQLDAADPKHIPIAVEMAWALLCATHGPLCGSRATATLGQLLLQCEDPRSKNSPLYPLTIGYGQTVPPTAPAAGPSAKAKGKQRAVPDDEPGEDRRNDGRGAGLGTRQSNTYVHTIPRPPLTF
ncbi:uncharacterized protein EDB93DRAFT_1250997 [Suillus bovinus]|uniref:uncharacterized protein n=1 Tax=Suillus bovinus TaxID=48563 RepID=UPI001B877BCD|nr:uncharacterized protein EDB93DRAFT_1250997 [Suillus bovinus]KAG2146460.1 hypothetical protein EDB93DRAFT_1250997 [Suillus bovinus]